MNMIRRKKLSDIIAQLVSIKESIESVLEEEEEARDSMPESLQTCERYEISDEACNNLGDAIDSLDEAIDRLEEASN